MVNRKSLHRYRKKNWIIFNKTNLLIGQSVQRSSQTVHTGSEWQIRIAQRRSDQMYGVSWYVTALVITMNRQVQSHQFDELSIVVAQHRGEVVTPIFVRVDGADARTVLVGVTVDCGCDDWYFSDHIHGVFVNVLKMENKNFKNEHWCVLENVKIEVPQGYETGPNNRTSCHKCILNNNRRRNHYWKSLRFSFLVKKITNLFLNKGKNRGTTRIQDWS